MSIEKITADNPLELFDKFNSQVFDGNNGPDVRRFIDDNRKRIEGITIAWDRYMEILSYIVEAKKFVDPSKHSELEEIFYSVANV